GKVDRRALPAPARSEPVGEREAPRTPQEAALAGIWAQALGRERVGIHDNFFDLGGDSILSIQVVSRAQQAGLWITPRDLFQHQTVATLAAVAGAAPVPSGGEDAAGDVPLTPVQRRFFAADLTGFHHFNQSLLLGLREPADPGRLEQALGRVVACHAALRCRFLLSPDGSWRQTVQPAAPGTEPPLAVCDLAALPPADRRGALEGAAASLQESLDPAGGPVLRATLFSLGGGEQRLFLAVHHLVIDGVS
ncbi:MAG TPA: non-ribosomal peptide synthetase, partial [Acidobacteria bacterium]|nr:non-ribosomal peptide synthetase [Acidobacteriota bacterium]